MDDYQPLGKAAEFAGVSRVSVSRWVRMKLLKARPGPKIGNLQTTLVSVSAVKEIAKRRPPGRPRKVQTR